jgi:hypothetical protein
VSRVHVWLPKKEKVLETLTHIDVKESGLFKDVRVIPQHSAWGGKK